MGSGVFLGVEEKVRTLLSPLNIKAKGGPTTDRMALVFILASWHCTVTCELTWYWTALGFYRTDIGPGVAYG